MSVPTLNPPTETTAREDRLLTRLLRTKKLFAFLRLSRRLNLR